MTDEQKATPRVQNPSETALSGAMLGFSAVVVSNLFGSPVTDGRMVAALCMFGLAMPIFVAYMVVMYGATRPIVLEWLDRAWMLAIALTLGGFFALVWQLSDLAAIATAIGALLGVLILLGAVSGSRARNSLPVGWESQYQPKNNEPD